MKQSRNKSNKHILILNWRDIRHPLAGGAEKVTHIYAMAWLKKGYRVTQISCSFTNGKQIETINGVQIIRMGNHYTVHYYAMKYYLKNLKGTIDIIIDEFHFIPFLSIFYAQVPIVGFIHELARNLWFQNTNFIIASIGYVIEPLLIWLYKNKQFITVSDSTKQELVKFGISKDAITIIPNGYTYVKTKAYFKEPKPTIIYLGRITKDKGAEDALKAFSLVRRSISARLWIVGTPDNPKYEKQLESIIDEYRISSHVQFFGHVSDQKKYELLKRSWVLINPSPREGWGLVNIEANASETPVVGYDVPGIRDSVIHEKTGLLVKKGDVGSLAEQLSLVLENKTLRTTLGKNARKHARMFSWEKTQKKSVAFMKRAEKIYYGK